MGIFIIIVTIYRVKITKKKYLYLHAILTVGNRILFEVEEGSQKFVISYNKKYVTSDTKASLLVMARILF